MHRVEFTIEPFREGDPGPHVTQAIAAARDLGAEVEIGPFGSACTVDAASSAELVAAVVRAAFGHGASHVNIDVDVVGVEGGGR